MIKDAVEGLALVFAFLAVSSRCHIPEKQHKERSWRQRVFLQWTMIAGHFIASSCLQASLAAAAATEAASPHIYSTPHADRSSATSSSAGSMNRMANVCQPRFWHGCPISISSSSSSSSSDGGSRRQQQDVATRGGSEQ